jgi:hypothetical protein
MPTVPGPMPAAARPPQLHCELVASVKLLTELTTLAASLPTVAICEAEGLDGSAVTEFLSALTEEEMALVWLGKSLLAELTSAVASLWICDSWDFRVLMLTLVRPLTEFSRVARSVQYAGLLLLQPVSATTAIAAPEASRTRARPRGRADLALIPIVTTSSTPRVHHP